MKNENVQLRFCYLMKKERADSVYHCSGHVKSQAYCAKANTDKQRCLQALLRSTPGSRINTLSQSSTLTSIALRTVKMSVSTVGSPYVLTLQAAWCKLLKKRRNTWEARGRRWARGCSQKKKVFAPPGSNKAAPARRFNTGQDDGSVHKRARRRPFRFQTGLANLYGTDRLWNGRYHRKRSRGPGCRYG